MSSDQVQNAKNSAGEATEKTKAFGEEKTGQAQKQAQGLGKSAQDTNQAALNKAGEAKDQTASALQQAGDKATETFNNLKQSVTGK